MPKRNRINNSIGIGFVLLTLLFAGCSKPYNGYDFITRNVDNKGDVNRYSFSFEMDSTEVYNTFVACSVDGLKVTSDYIRLKISVKSPSGDVFEETLPFPLRKVENVKIKQHTNFIDIEWPYRQNVSTGEAGIWTVTIKPDPSQDEAVLGIGFAYNNLFNGKG